MFLFFDYIVVRYCQESTSVVVHFKSANCGFHMRLALVCVLSIRPYNLCCHTASGESFCWSGRRSVRRWLKSGRNNFSNNVGQKHHCESSQISDRTRTREYNKNFPSRVRWTSSKYKPDSGKKVTWTGGSCRQFWAGPGTRNKFLWSCW